MSPDVAQSRAAVVEQLKKYRKLLEIGIGNRPAVAAALAAEGRTIRAIDIATPSKALPEEVAFEQRSVHDLVTDASNRGPAQTYHVNAVYAFNLPAELQSATVQVATAADADCLFTTLGFESPVIDVTSLTVGEATLYRPAGTQK